MNQATFANMGGARPPPMANQHVGGMQRNGGTSSDIQPQILDLLQAQPIPPGWQQIVPPKQRANFIHQMVTGLRMVKQEMDVRYAIHVASGFETQQFTMAPDKESYEQSIHRKLTEIHATRQSQANMQQQQFQNQQAAQMSLTQQQMQARGMMNNHNQFQPGFGIPQPPQPGQPGQPLGMPMQQQLSQNHGFMQNSNSTEMQQPAQTVQPLQNMPRSGPPNRGQAQFTPEETQQINNMTRQMLAKMDTENRMKLQRRLATTLSAQQQQAMQAQSYDPVVAYLRSQATHLFVNERQKRMQANGQGMTPSASGAMATQGRPMSQISVRNQQQLLPPSTTQQVDTDQILGQQREGFRHQAAGQDVVPASNGQAAAAQMRGTPHQPLQGQFGPNRPMQPPNFPQQPQPKWNGAQTQQTAHMPMQPPTPNFANRQGQNPQQQALQGQVGGLSNVRGQRTPQQNHNMPTLNQPMEAPSQAKNEKPSQPTPKQTPRNGPNGQSASIGNVKPNPSQPSQITPSLQGPIARLPPHIQAGLGKMSEEQRKQFFLQWKKKQQEQQERTRAAAEAQGSGNGPSALHSGPQGPSAGAKVDQGNESQTNNFQATSATNYTGPQPNSSAINRVSMGQQQGSQQGPDPSRPVPPRMVPMPLNEVQVRFMDSQNFPPAILNKSNSLGQLPDSVKTWRQLKDYVQQNLQSLPSNSINNVVGLQSIHMQQIQAANSNNKRMQQFQALNQGTMKPGQTGPAPQAPPMIPPQMNPPAVPGMAPPGSFPMPQLPQPTIQEVHSARATLPDSMKGISDNQLRSMIYQRRQQEYAKVNQQGLNPQQQMMMQRNALLQAQRISAQAGQLPMGQNQPGPMSQPQRAQVQTTQPAQQHVQPPAPPKQPNESQVKPSQASRQGHVAQTGPKGAKTIPNDDVVEVPDPKTTQQQRPQHSRPGLPPQVNGTQQMTPEAFARLSPEQKFQFQQRFQEAQMAQRAKLGLNNQNSLTQASMTTNPNAGPNNRRDPALEALTAEVAKNTPRRPVVPMSLKERNQMVEKLKDRTASLMQRIEQTLPHFLHLTKNINQAKEVLRMRLILLHQVKDPSFQNPVENFTMTIQELDEYKLKLNQHISSMITAPPAVATAKQPSSQPQQLSAANLQQHQAIFNAARAASTQKTQANDNSRAPAAPTATHPPFPFGSQSPQGVPQIYAGKNELTQEQLKLPQAKKRKPNQAVSAASTPAQTMITPVAKSSPVPKVESPEVQRASGAANLILCTVANCESGKVGFTTKEDLEKHHVEVHEPKEPVIKDPLDAAAYAIESLCIALNLDENGKSRPSPISKDDKTSIKEDRGSLQAPPMKASGSSQSQAMKQEVATPMSRIPTQTGPSPSSNQFRTPQGILAGKTPTSDAKPAGKDTGTRGLETKALSTATSDPWANSHVKPEWFEEVFSDCANLNRTVPDDFISSWVERNPFTPATTNSSGALEKDSPHKSDISTNDNLHIDVTVGGKDWIYSEWYDDGLRGDMEALDVGDLMEMDWNTTVGKTIEEEEALGKGKRRRDPVEPSDEWLKAWAPEKLEEKKKNDAQRKR